MPALLAVFLESLGSLHVAAFLGYVLSYDGARKFMLPAFLNFHLSCYLPGSLVLD
jgi:hypothetical protein